MEDILMRKRLWFFMAGASLVVSLFTTQQTSAQDAVKIDPAIPAYKAVSGISGNLNSIGSDTLNNLMTLWAEGFKKMYPNVNVQIEGKGSSTAPPRSSKARHNLVPCHAQCAGPRLMALRESTVTSPLLYVPHSIHSLCSFTKTIRRKDSRWLRSMGCFLKRSVAKALMSEHGDKWGLMVVGAVHH